MKKIYDKLIEKAASDSKYIDIAIFLCLLISFAIPVSSLDPAQEHYSDIVFILSALVIMLIGIFIFVPRVISRIWPQFKGEVYFYTFLAFLISPYLITGFFNG